MYQVDHVVNLRSQGEVFVSYSHHDRELVRAIVSTLERAGFRVWWDHYIPAGENWDSNVDKALDRATCVVVLWSSNSVASQHVRAEAHKANDKGILVAARIDRVAPGKLPVPFNVVQTVDLSIPKPALRGNELSEQQVASYRAEMDRLIQGIDRVFRSVQLQSEMYKKSKGTGGGCGTLLGIGAIAVILYLLFGQGTSPPAGESMAGPTPGPVTLTPKWNDYLCIGNEECTTGDFNGDGRTDVAVLVRDTQADDRQGNVNVAVSTGNAFANSAKWADYLCTGTSSCRSADVNGDSLDDLVEFGGGSDGIVRVALSTGSSLLAPSFWRSNFCVAGQACEVGDFNGDGRADIVAFSQGNDAPGLVYVALNTGNGFGPESVWHSSFCISGDTCGIGDFNGDGKDDIIAFAKSNAKVYVALSSGVQFLDRYVDGTTNNLWHKFFCLGQEVCTVGDFNGDGVDDIVTFLRSTQPDKIGEIYIAHSSTTHFGTGQKLNEFYCIGAEICGIGDFNGDGSDDVVTFLRSTQVDKTGDVYVALTP